LIKTFFTALSISLLLTSCMSKEVAEDCEDLSMKCYRGFPRKCNKLKKTCSGKKIRYTAELCQKAFNDLMFGREFSQVLGVYGKRVEGCFNEREIYKYKK